MLFGLAARSGGLNNVVERLFYTKPGSMIFSGLIGLAIALLFSRVCKDKKCIVIHAPPLEDIKDNIYILDGSCYKYTPIATKCENNEVIASA